MHACVAPLRTEIGADTFLGDMDGSQIEHTDTQKTTGAGATFARRYCSLGCQLVVNVLTARNRRNRHASSTRDYARDAAQACMRALVPVGRCETIGYEIVVHMHIERRNPKKRDPQPKPRSAEKLGA
eukprot:6179131-Pleurochrysis_carterae.AAC.2